MWSATCLVVPCLFYYKNLWSPCICGLRHVWLYPVFPPYLCKRQEFLENKIEHKMCILIFSATFSLQHFSFSQELLYIIINLRGPGSSVGIVTDQGLDGPGSNRGGDEIFLTCLNRPWGPPNLLYNGYGVFTGGRGGRGVGLTPPPHLVPRSQKEQSCTTFHLKRLRGL